MLVQLYLCLMIVWMVVLHRVDSVSIGYKFEELALQIDRGASCSFLLCNSVEFFAVSVVIHGLLVQELFSFCGLGFGNCL